MSTSDTSAESRALKHIQRKIAELEQKKHLAPEMVGVVSEIVKRQHAAQEAVRFAGASEQKLPPEILARLTPSDAHIQGMPLLPAADFPIDMAVAEELARAVQEILAEKAPQLQALIIVLKKQIQKDPGLLARACEEVRATSSMHAQPGKNGDSCLDIWEKAHPEAPSLLRFVAQSAIMPSLAVAAQCIGEHRRPEAIWLHGHCPICGSQPLIGRLADSEGVRKHVCSFCSYEYRVPRLGCPFCLATPQDNALYFSSEDEPGYALDVCASCNAYIKIADFRTLDRAWVPMLDDLASLTLDLYARQMGYVRPTLSAWGF